MFDPKPRDKQGRRIKEEPVKKGGTSGEGDAKDVNKLKEVQSKFIPATGVQDMGSKGEGERMNAVGEDATACLTWHSSVGSLVGHYLSNLVGTEKTTPFTVSIVQIKERVALPSPWHNFNGE